MLRRILSVVTVAAAATLAVAAPAHAGPTWVAGYVWASQPTTADYVAATGYEYNSSGGTVQIRRTGTGAYTVVFHGAAAPNAVAHANSYGSGNSGYCTLSSFAVNGSDEVLAVRCFTVAGVAADQRFVADMTNRHDPGVDFAYVVADRPTAVGPYVPAIRYDSAGTVDTVERNAPGVYLVVLGLAQLLDYYADPVHVQVTALTKAAVHCQHTGPQDETPVPLAVVCQDADGNRVDSAFTLSFTHKANLLGATAGTAFGDVNVQPVWGTGVPVVRTWYASAGGPPVVTHVRTGEYQVNLPGLDIGAGHVIVHSAGNTLAACTIAYWWNSGADVQCWDYAGHAPADTEFTLALTA